jgi:SAM-dependent methyltransferase
MSHFQQREFITKVKSFLPEFFKDVHVVEIGSLNINGTVRDFFETPKSYVGIDLIEGKDVDVICFGKDYTPDTQVDTVISTECFEHDKDWKETFENMYNITRPEGLVVFTCASDGRHEHGTTRTSPADSPATNDYYMNLNEEHFRTAFDIDSMFYKSAFEYNPVTCDLYFWGIKK